MSDEDLKRAIEFLVEQQSRYSARMDRDESRLARLENAFVTLAKLARVSNERTTMATLREVMDNLAKRMITLAEAQAPLHKEVRNHHAAQED